MATKVTDFYYQVSPTETITFTISGPDDPRVFLDNTTLSVVSGTSFDVTPQMLNGIGAVHFLRCILLFAAGPGSYSFSVDGSGGNIDSFTIPGPSNGSFSQVVINIEVA